MSLKILYAASSRAGAKLQLFRFLHNIQGYDIEIKIAGYRKLGIYLDWTLDALNDILHPDLISIDNEIFEIYHQQIKAFNPDLIISDLEPYTSYAGQQLDITTWQVSPLLFRIGREKPSMSYMNNYATLFDFLQHDLYKNIIINSNKRFVYSYIGDLPNSPKLSEGYEWIRPYHCIGAKSIPCQHNLVAALHKTDKRLKSLLGMEDTVVFADSSLNIASKSIYDMAEYGCNVKNAKRFISQGLTDLLSDAIYNNIAPIIVPDLFDAECALNSIYLDEIDGGLNSYDGQIHKEPKEINLAYNENIGFLHNKIEALL